VNKAIAREKQIKAWTRAKRIALIKTQNPAWQDVAEDWGLPAKLQVPHFVRDDNTDNGNENADSLEQATNRASENVSLKAKAKTA
jgi:hypothetical protein